MPKRKRMLLLIVSSIALSQFAWAADPPKVSSNECWSERLAASVAELRRVVGEDLVHLRAANQGAANQAVYGAANAPTAYRGLSRLARKAHPYSRVDDIPVTSPPRGARGMPTRRYLHTKDIEEAALGYRQPERYLPRRISRSHTLPKRLEDFPQTENVQPSDILITSDRGGNFGWVRLGELESGRPVALKSYPRFGEDFVLEEAQSLQLLEELGVGPKFHGVYFDPKTRKWNLVMDIVVGDAPSAQNISKRSFQDLEEIFRRYEAAGVSEVKDLQFIVQKGGHLTVIDPSGLKRSLRGPKTSLSEDAMKSRYRLVQKAEPRVVIQYLEDLKVNDPALFRAVIVHLGQNQSGLKPELKAWVQVFL